MIFSISKIALPEEHPLCLIKFLENNKLMLLNPSGKILHFFCFSNGGSNLFAREYIYHHSTGGGDYEMY